MFYLVAFQICNIQNKSSLVQATKKVDKQEITARNNDLVMNTIEHKNVQCT